MGRSVIFGSGREKLDSVVDSHVKHFGDIFAAIAYVKHLAFVALAVTLLALYGYVGHELHLYGDGALTLASLAATTLDIE